MADHDTHDHTGVTGVPSATAPNPTTIELGHASDTTLSRASAGVVAVEGTNLVKAGAATGSGLTMATARLLGRTTASTGAIEEITVGSGLTLSGGALAASGGAGTDYASASTDTAQNITSGAAVAIIDFEDVTFDPGSDITTGAAWKYTAPTTGIYHVSAAIRFAASGAWSAATERGLLQLFKNGSNFRTLDYEDGYITAGANITVMLAGDTLVSLAATDYIDVRLAQNTGSTIALDGSGAQNYINIHRVA